ncbi:leucine-rich repeat domain-containing protein [Candidatus Saccharibacteria bacterium]|nr:leucine-rich repeat domain-containing protein [Candidatus Saccharibacteria bacterium]
MNDVLRALDALPRSTRRIELRHLVNKYNTPSFTEFPRILFEFKDLEYLSISNNEITVIPPEIGQFKKLQELRMGFNEIYKLPPEIGQLTELRVLSVLHNKISELPDEICILPNLCKLDCEFNKLTSLPKNIGNLANLKELNAVANELTTLPDSICRLPECKISVYLNKIKTLPMAFKPMTNIYYGHTPYEKPMFVDTMTMTEFLSALLEVLK